MNTYVKIGALFVLGLPVLFSNRALAIADQGGPIIGEVPPPLTLTKTLQGPPAAEINWARLKGKVVVLEFWATWCGPCVAAIPHLNELAERFKAGWLRLPRLQHESSGERFGGGFEKTRH